MAFLVHKLNISKIFGGSNEAARLQSLGVGYRLEPNAVRSHSCTVVRGDVAAYATSAAKVQYPDQAFPAHIQPGECAPKVRRWPSIYDLFGRGATRGRP